MRILILGDSLSFPQTKLGQSFDETWPVLLRRELPDADVWQRAAPRATVRDVASEFSLFSDSLGVFQALVVQVGIVDCAPRPHPYVVERLISKFGSARLRKRVDRGIYPLLKFRAKPWIDEESFRSELERILRAAVAANPGLRVRLVPIAPPGLGMKKIFTGIEGYVARYNAALERAARASGLAGDVLLLDPYRDVPVEELVLKDGHHLSGRGHAAVAAAVARTLREPAAR